MQEFNSAKNKSLLWNLLYEGGVFHGISEERVETVKNKLDEVVQETWDRRIETDDLKELNKRVCQMMLVASERIRAPALPNTNAPPLVTAEELSAQRQATFSNNFERKQSEFTQLMTNDRPTDIDFTDKFEEPLVALDQALEELQARRTQELNKALGDQDHGAAAAWIQCDEPSLNKHIKIGEEAILKDDNIQHIAEEKKVRFQIPSPAIRNEASGFLEKLKTTKPVSSTLEAVPIIKPDTIEDRLILLEKGQKTIIAMLTQILTK